MEPSIPSQMKAAAIDRFGGPDVLHVATLPVPLPGAHEVLLRVDTAGIGVWDPWVREGGFDDGSTRFPYVMGNDGAGVVVAVGPKVRRLRVGDHAYGFQMEGGFYGEYVKLHEDCAARIPKRIDAREAGALGADGITGLRGLEDQLRLRRGQSLMIVGGSGGIGHMAVQLAKRMGARVLAVASRPDGVELVKRLGADAAVDGRAGEIAGAARTFAPDGLDAALVLAGGEGVDEALKGLKKGGRVAYPNGVEPEPKAPKGVKLLAYDGTPSAEAFDRLNQLIGDQPFHVELWKVYRLDEVARAHREVEEHHLGKLALRIHW
ncbi:MAG: NADP-dependent oxidoreductase [Myxococcales bacterium]|nr:NADP-dependent oxidoreductase [Myxococcales bacterium]